MIQLYIFILSLATITIIISRRRIIFKRNEKIAFKEKIASKVEENRKIEQIENKKRFKDELEKKQESQTFDFKLYKDEMRSADMAISKKQWNLAKRSLIKALTFSKDELAASLKLAMVYMESGDYKKSESLYRKLLEIDGTNPDIYESIGKILVKKGRYKEAVELYSRALEFDEKDDKKLIALGRLYHLLMHYSYAAECFRRAAELKPREVSYLFLLADSCKLDDDYDNALFTYERILTVEPYNDKAKNYVNDLQLKIKENESFFQGKLSQQE